MDHTIRFIRGDTYVVNLEVKDSAGFPYVPLEADTITMTVRLNDYKGMIVIQKKTGDSDVAATETGWRIVLQPSDTSALQFRNYVYDMQLDMSGVIQTVIPLSKFILDKEMTY